MAKLDYPFKARGFPLHFRIVHGFFPIWEVVIPGLSTAYPQDCGKDTKVGVGFGGVA